MGTPTDLFDLMTSEVLNGLSDIWVTETKWSCLDSFWCFKGLHRNRLRSHRLTKLSLSLMLELHNSREIQCIALQSLQRVTDVSDGTF